MKGIIVKGIGGFYYVKTSRGIFQAKGRGIFKKDGIVLSVGDCVDFELLPDGDGIINSIEPRKNSFIRPPIANVDSIVVTFAGAKPKPDFALLDKFLVMAEYKDIEPAICINKEELLDLRQREKIENIYGKIYPLFFTSGKTGQGMKELLNFVQGKKVAFAGPSGVGKSTIINILIPHASMETGTVSQKTHRGRHTTRHVEIFHGSGDVMIFDTPGFTSFDIPEEIDEFNLADCYPEIRNEKGLCRFDNCIHIKEPECHVKAMVADGKISEERYKSYCDNVEEIRKRKKY